VSDAVHGRINLTRVSCRPVERQFDGKIYPSAIETTLKRDGRTALVKDNRKIVFYRAFAAQGGQQST
jgi:hypothetical protein